MRLQNEQRGSKSRIRRVPGGHSTDRSAPGTAVNSPFGHGSHALKSTPPVSGLNLPAAAQRKTAKSQTFGSFLCPCPLQSITMRAHIIRLHLPALLTADARCVALAALHAIMPSKAWPNAVP
eukprot:5223030-Prymnesium_polylepis.1